jgi:hypothetical protein
MNDKKGTNKDAKGTSEEERQLKPKGTTLAEKGCTETSGSETISAALQYFIKNANTKFKEGVFRVNPEFWHFDSAYPVLNPDKNASNALRDMVSATNSNKYLFDCTNFAYFASLYAVLETINNDSRFDRIIEYNALSFFARDQTTQFFPVKQYADINSVPIGSRIYLKLYGELTNIDGNKQPFKRLIPQFILAEYCLKVTDQKYYGHGITDPARLDNWEVLVHDYLKAVISYLPKKFIEFGDENPASAFDDYSRIIFLFKHHIEDEVRIIQIPPALLMKMD